MTTTDRPSNAPSHAPWSALVARGEVDLPMPLRLVEAGLGVAVAACVLLVHDVAYLLQVPYWLDEAWVADSTRVSVGHLLDVTSATPVGWTFLLRLVPG